MNKGKWKCSDCKLHHKKPIASPTTTKSPILDEQNKPQSLLSVDAKSIMDHIDNRFDNLRSIMESFKSEITNRLNKLSNTVSTWESKINCMESSLNDWSDQIAQLSNEKTKLQSEVTELQSKLIDILECNNRNEQWVRRSNIQINGVPQTEGENLMKIIRNLASKSGYELNTDTDIDFVTRVAVKSNSEHKKPKPIIMKFHSRYKKDDFQLSMRKLKDLKASDLGFKNSVERIYINDHLSTRNKALLQQAKRKAKEKGYAYCWVRNCTIMVRKTKDSNVIHVSSEKSLNKIT